MLWGSTTRFLRIRPACSAVECQQVRDSWSIDHHAYLTVYSLSSNSYILERRPEWIFMPQLFGLKAMGRGNFSVKMCSFVAQAGLALDFIIIWMWTWWVWITAPTCWGCTPFVESSYVMEGIGENLMTSPVTPSVWYLIDLEIIIINVYKRLILNALRFEICFVFIVDESWLIGGGV